MNGTNVIQYVGLDTSGEGLWYHDVLSTEDWALAMLPQPILGVLMLFPIKDKASHATILYNALHEYKTSPSIPYF